MTAWIATLAACASVPTPATDAAQALIPVRDLVADLNGSGAYQISPDGQRLMWMARLGLGPGLFVKNLKTGEVNSYKIPGAGVWARDSRHILLHLSNNGDENSHVWALDTDKPAKPARDLTPFAGARSYILRQLPRSGDLIIASNQRNAQFDDVYRYTQATGVLTRLATNPGRVGEWLINNDGEVTGRARLEGEEWIYETPGAQPEDAWMPQFRVSYFDTVTLVAPSATPSHWWALSNRGGDKLALVEIDLRDGSEHVKHADARVDVSGWLWSPRQQKPLAAVSEPDTQQWQAFDPAVQQALNKLKGATEARITINNLSRARLSALAGQSDRLPQNRRLSGPLPGRAHGWV